MEIITLLEKGFIYAGERKVVPEGNGRYKLYLPMRLNAIWEEIHKNDVKVEVFIRIKKE